MSLPKISHPLIEIKVPSTKKTYTFRPMLVKEEKILMIAKSSDDEKDMLSAVKQVVNNCFIDDVDIDKFTLFDIEYLFLKLRAYSVNNIVTLYFKDLEDDKEYKFDVDLLEIEVKFPENISNKVEITNKTGIVLKYPSSRLYDDKEFLDTESYDDMYNKLLISAIDKVYDENTVYKSDDYKSEELVEFLNDLPIVSYNKMREFVDNSPKIEKILEYKDANGKEKKIYLNTLNDFFQLR